MGERYSVNAILSATDRNFSSVFSSAEKSTSNLKSMLTSGIGFGAMMAIGSKAMSTITGSVTNLIGEISSSNAAWKTFQGNMEIMGKGSEEIAGVKKELQAFAEQTIYSSSDMASTFAQLEAVGTKNTTALVKGFGGLAAAAEDPKQAMKTLSQQATQMAAKPKVAWMDFKLMIDQTPAGIAAVAREMGISSAELITKVQEGTVATQDFFDAIAKVGTSEGFTKLATEYKTVGQAMDGLTETVGNKLTPAFDILSSVGIKAISGIIDKIGALNETDIATKFSSMLSKASKYWAVFKENFTKVKKAFTGAVGEIISEVTKLTGAFGSSKSVQSFSDVVGAASEALVDFLGFIKEHADVIAKVISILPQLLLAYNGFKIVKAVTPFIGIFTGAIGGLAKLFGKGQPLGEGSNPGRAMVSLKEGLNSLQKCAGVALVIAAIAGLALAIKPLAELGTTAIAPLLTFGVVVGGLGLILANMGSKLQTSMGGIIAFAASVSVMALAMAPIASTGTEGAIAIGAFGLVVAALIIVFATFGTALTAAIPAMLVFGVAILLVGAGMALASILINALTSFIKQLGDTISQVATSIASAIETIATSFSGLVTAISNAVTQIINAIGNTLTNIIQTAGDTISKVIESISDGFVKISDGVATVVDAIGGAFSSVLQSVAEVIDSVGTAAKNAGKGFKNVAEGIETIAGLSVMDIAKSLGAVALGMGKISEQSSGLTGAANGMKGILSSILSASGSISLFSASLSLMSKQSSLVAGSVEAIKAAFLGLEIPRIDVSPLLASISSVVKGTKTMSVQVGLVGAQAGEKLASGLILGYNRAKTYTETSVSSINSAVRKLPELLRVAGTQAGNAFTRGLTVGANPSISVARTISSSVVSALGSASGGAYSAGYRIGQDLANGMKASLGIVRSIAAQLAQAANAAVKAKSQVPQAVSQTMSARTQMPSPFRFFDTGLADGVGLMESPIYERTEHIAVATNIGTVPETINWSYQPEALKSDKDYSYDSNPANVTYTINSYVDLDGRQVGYGTAKYTQEELTRKERVNNRRNGIR